MYSRVRGIARARSEQNRAPSLFNKANYVTMDTYRKRWVLENVQEPQVLYESAATLKYNLDVDSLRTSEGEQTLVVILRYDTADSTLSIIPGRGTSGFETKRIDCSTQQWNEVLPPPPVATDIDYV